MLRIKRFVLGPLRTNTYIVYDEIDKVGFIIDPGEPTTALVNFVKSRGIKIKAVIATHGHFDHVLGVDFIRNSLGVEFYMHKDDVKIAAISMEWAKLWLDNVDILPPHPDHYIDEGDVLNFGSIDLEVIHTPGHSPGSVCLYLRSSRVLFSGDTLFRGTVGRTDLPGGSEEHLKNSLIKIFRTFDDDVKVFPGHGGDTTIGIEKHTNIFVRNLLKS